MAHSTKKLKKEINDKRKPARTLEEIISKSDTLLNNLDILFLNVYRRKIGVDEYEELLKSVLKEIKKVTEGLKAITCSIDKSDSKSDYDRAIKTLAKLKAKLERLPANYKEATLLGNIVELKKKINCSIDDYKFKDKNMSDLVRDFSIDPENINYDVMLPFLLNQLSCLTASYNKLLREAVQLDYRANSIKNKSEGEKSHSKEELIELLSVSLKQSEECQDLKRNINIKVELETLKQLELDDEELRTLIDSLICLLSNNEHISREIREKCILMGNNVAVVTSKDVLDDKPKLTIDRNKSENFISFKNNSIERLRELKLHAIIELAISGTSFAYLVSVIMNLREPNKILFGTMALVIEICKIGLGSIMTISSLKALIDDVINIVHEKTTISEYDTQNDKYI